MTSRHTDSKLLGQCIPVSIMSESESLHLLLHEEEKIKGRRIASTLGYLPLTFDQAGAHIRARCLSLKDFISHYDKRKEKVPVEIPDQWEYRRNITLFSVFTTWKLSFDQTGGDDVEIRNKDPFLTLTAFFDNKIIWERYHYNIGLPGGIWWMGQSYLPNFRDSHCYRHRLSRSTIYDSPYIPLSGTGLVKLRKNHDVHTAAIWCGSNLSTCRIIPRR